MQKVHTQLQPMLKGLTILADSISQASLLALELAKDQAKEVVEMWVNVEAETRSDGRRLALMYLCNDVVQRSQAGEDGGLLQKEFAKWLIKLFPVIMQKIQDQKVKDQMVGLLKIWEERHIYTPEFITKMKDAIDMAQAGEGRPGQPTISYHL